MKLAYATTFDARDVNNWSGTPFHIAQEMQRQGIHLDYIGPLERHLEPFFKIKQFWKQIVNDERESPRFNTVAAKHYAEQVALKLATLDVQAVFAPLLPPIAYLDCKQPIAFWTDGLYANFVNFYASFAKHSASTQAQGHALTKACLARTKLAIFCSDWAAQSALEYYGTPPEKVKVVPFGANIDCTHDLATIKDIIKKRDHKVIKFLFLGKSWHRKGGDIVLNVIKALHAMGHAVELTIVGCEPPKTESIPSYVKCLGFISKRTAAGMEQIKSLLREAHFLFVPSRAEAYGIVFCEANAFGLPCLTSTAGGIPTIVKNNINGMTFALDAPVTAYCDYVVNLMRDYTQYTALAESAFNEYQTRLNWQAALQTVKGLIQTII